MIKKINTKEEECFLNIEQNVEGILHIWFVDDIFDTKKKLATYDNGKWKYNSEHRMDEFIKLIKRNPMFKKLFFKTLNNPEQKRNPNERFKRIFKFRCYKTINKVKRIKII